MQIRIFTILLSLAAEAILAVVFFVLIPHEWLADDLRWLDFAVMTVINSIWVCNILFPFVNLADRSHKEVGGLGLRWTATGWYSALAFLFLLANIIYARYESHAMGFGLQATIQAALLLLFLCGIVASKASIDKSRDVYVREMAVKKGKADIKAAVAGVLSAAEDTAAFPHELTGRIRRVASDTRYMAPSASAESTMADEKILDDCDSLMAYLTDPAMNKELIETCVGRLERDLQARRRLS